MRARSVPRAALAAAAILFATACGGGSADQGGFEGSGPVPVLVAKAQEKTVAEKAHAIGRVEPYSTVDIKARIDGQITQVHFRQGLYVKTGDLLFTIDPLPFEAALHQAEANLARDLAQEKQAIADASRYEFLLKQSVGSQQQYDQAKAAADADRATVAADEAVVQTARLNLGYTTIRSPIDGRTGDLLLHPGNLVKANADNPMLVINQIHPVYVDFALPEQNLADIRRYMAERKLTVEVVVPGEQGPVERGELSFIDNAVDTKTGTIALKGLFENLDDRLWPGQFVDATLLMNERPNAIIVPSQAVQTGQDGSYVFVVGADMKVTPRTIVAGDSLDGDTVVERGLKAGETVVTDGQLRLIPGAKVMIKSGLGGTAS